MRHEHEQSAYTFWLLQLMMLKDRTYTYDRRASKGSEGPNLIKLMENKIKVPSSSLLHYYYLICMLCVVY
jgi:hypothetical protein